VRQPALCFSWPITDLAASVVCENGAIALEPYHVLSASQQQVHELTGCVPLPRSTINSLLNERVATATAFQADVAKPTTYSRRAAGFTLHCIDTPSILEQDIVSDAVRGGRTGSAAAVRGPGWETAMPERQPGASCLQQVLGFTPPAPC
jgi:hypothetical protein